MFEFFWSRDNNNADLQAKREQQGPPVKICPKCKRLYREKTFVCIYDETLLAYKNPPLHEQQTPQPISSFSATRPDGSKWNLICKKTISSGSMCDAYEAYCTNAGTSVVVKVLLSPLMCDEKSEKKYLEGARLALPLAHENIVSSLAYGTYDDKTHKCIRPFTVYEHTNGHQLSTLIDKDQLPTPQDTLAIAGDICAALQYAHERGVVHGDLKPSNIFLEKSGDIVRARVCDFAVAERVFRGLEWDKIATITCSLYGCAAYLAPDYASSRQSTVSADIYSLGCVLYECLTGAPPFTGNNDFMTIMQHMNQAPKPLDSKSVPTVVSAIVMKALAKDPLERWQSAEQMGVAIKVAEKQLLMKA